MKACETNQSTTESSAAFSPSSETVEIIAWHMKSNPQASSQARRQAG